MFRRLQPRIVLLVILVCVLAACNSNDSDLSNSASKTPVGTAPPNTALPMPPMNGTINNLGWNVGGGKRNVFSDFKGKVLVLDLYATWCDPCRKTIPHLIELQNKYESQGLKVVGLNVGGADDEEKVPAFAQEFGIQYTLGQPDEELITFLMAGNDAIPQTFVFDRQGQLAVRLVGYTANYEQRIDSAIEAGLKTPAP